MKAVTCTWAGRCSRQHTVEKLCALLNGSLVANDGVHEVVQQPHTLVTKDRVFDAVTFANQRSLERGHTLALLVGAVPAACLPSKGWCSCSIMCSMSQHANTMPTAGALSYQMSTKGRVTPSHSLHAQTAVIEDLDLAGAAKSVCTAC